MLRLVIVVAIAAPACAGPKDLGSATRELDHSLYALTDTRLRCGSERLRTRLRSGDLVVERVGKPAAVLRPLVENGTTGSAYGDGSLTLYRIPGRDSWALKTANGSKEAPCNPDPVGGQGTGKSDIPAK